MIFKVRVYLPYKECTTNTVYFELPMEPNKLREEEGKLPFHLVEDFETPIEPLKHMVHWVDDLETLNDVAIAVENFNIEQRAAFARYPEIFHYEDPYAALIYINIISGFTEEDHRKFYEMTKDTQEYGMAIYKVWIEEREK